MPPAAHADALDHSRDVRSSLQAYLELSKPGVTRLVLVTTALGVIAAPQAFRWLDLLATVAGTALVVVGANSLNMFLERESDRFMTRTRGRPLPTGRLSAESALVFGVLSSLAGLVVLASVVSMAAVALATFALLSYVLVYTPLKKVSSLALYVGAIPGALPPAIGYAAITGTLDGVGLWLFLILFVWQLPHFLAISVFRRNEYGRAGLQVLPNERGVPFTKMMIVAFAATLWAVTLSPYWLGLAGPLYGVVALLSGLAFALLCLRGMMTQGPGEESSSAAAATRPRPQLDRWSRTVFFASMPHLVLVLGTLVAFGV